MTEALMMEHARKEGEKWNRLFEENEDLLVRAGLDSSPTGNTIWERVNLLIERVKELEGREGQRWRFGPHCCRSRQPD